MGYTMDPDPETTAKAYGKNLYISPKASVEICDMVRGKDTEEAVEMLKEVMEGERAVPYKKHDKRVAHNKGVGSGRYPEKAAEKIRDMIEEAQHNAENKGLDSENMEILSLVAHKGEKMEGYQPRAYGRSTPSNKKNTNIEVILKEKEV